MTSSGPHQRRVHPSGMCLEGAEREASVQHHPHSGVRRPEAQSLTPAQTAFVAARVSSWGRLLLVVPPGLTGALGLSSDRRAMTTMCVLGVSHLVQAAVVGGRGQHVRGGAPVDLLHGVSTLPSACIHTLRRKAAPLDAGVAFAFAAGGLTKRTGDVGASAEPQPEVSSVRGQMMQPKAPQIVTECERESHVCLMFQRRVEEWIP